MASQQLLDAVPFYAGLTLEEIGGRGVRWQERDAAGGLPGRERAERGRRPRSPRSARIPSGCCGNATSPGSARCGTRSRFEHSPSLAFLHPRGELVAG